MPEKLEALRDLHHPRCFVGRAPEDFGLGVRFEAASPASVEATVAVTAEAAIRYRCPLSLGRTATVVGRVTQCEPPLYLVEARITSGDVVHATCRGKFMRRDID